MAKRDRNFRTAKRDHIITPLQSTNASSSNICQCSMSPSSFDSDHTACGFQAYSACDCLKKDEYLPEKSQFLNYPEFIEHFVNLYAYTPRLIESFKKATAENPNATYKACTNFPKGLWTNVDVDTSVESICECKNDCTCYKKKDIKLEIEEIEKKLDQCDDYMVRHPCVCEERDYEFSLYG